MIKKIGIVILVMISFHSYSADSVELSLQEVLRNAEKKNRSIQSHKLAMKVNDLEYIKMKKEFGPKLTLSGVEEFIQDNKFNEDGVGPVTLTLTQPIFTGGMLTGQLKQARLEKEITDLQMVTVSLDVREQVVDSFFKILDLKKQIEIIDRIIETLEKQRNRLEKLYTKGKLIPRSELLKVEADIITYRTDRVTIQKNIEVEKAALKVLMGVPFDLEYDILEFEIASLNIDGYSLKQDIRMALKSGDRAEIEDLQVKQADNNVKLARADYYPTVSLDASFAMKYNRIEGDNLQDTWALTLSAAWTMFDWGITLDQVKQSKYQKEQAELLYSENIDNIMLDITTKYNDMTSLAEQVKGQKAQLEISRENFRIDTLRYDNGIISSLDYLDSINQLKDAESSYYSLQRALVSAVDKYESSLK